MTSRYPLGSRVFSARQDAGVAVALPIHFSLYVLLGSIAETRKAMSGGNFDV